MRAFDSVDGPSCLVAQCLTRPRRGLPFRLDDGVSGSHSSKSSFGIELSVRMKSSGSVADQPGVIHSTADIKPTHQGSSFIAHRLPVRPISWTMHSSMRYIQPAAVTFRVDPLKPHREPRLIEVTRPVLGHVAPVSNGDVSMHFDLDGVEIAHVVLFVFDPLQKGLSIVHEQRLAACGPAIAVGECQVGCADTIDIGDVAARSLAFRRFWWFLVGSGRVGRGQAGSGLWGGGRRAVPWPSVRVVGAPATDRRASLADVGVPPGSGLVFLAVAVGTIIADRPPHRSVRALLRIRLPPRMAGVKALHRIRMENASDWNPSVHEPVEPVHGDTAALAAAR